MTTGAMEALGSPHSSSTECSGCHMDDGRNEELLIYGEVVIFSHGFLAER